MKKVASILISLLLVAAMVVPALGAVQYVPSIEQKEIEQPTEVVIEDSAGNVLYNVPYGEIIVTAISMKASAPLQSIKDHLTEATNDLNRVNTVGELTNEVFAAIENQTDIDASDLVVCDIFDVTATGTAKDYMDNGGILKVRLNVNIPVTDFVIAMHKHGGVWNVMSQENGLLEHNTDGSVVLTFHGLSPVVLVVNADSTVPQGHSPQTGITAVWYAVGGVLLVAAVCVIFQAKKRANH